MMARRFLCLLIAAFTATGCAEVAGLQEVTFLSLDAGVRETGPVDARGEAPFETGGDVAAEARADRASVTPPPRIENCPLCGGATCCGPKSCTSDDRCCTGRGESCSTNSDCCDNQCDIATSRCTGPCLLSGDRRCVTDHDCCAGKCNSEGVCAACANPGGGCSKDSDCCFGLSCTSSDGGTCLSL